MSTIKNSINTVKEISLDDFPNKECKKILNQFAKNIKTKLSSYFANIITRKGGNLLAKWCQNKLHDGWMGVKHKCHDLMGPVNDTYLSWAMAIMNTKTQNV